MDSARRPRRRGRQGTVRAPPRHPLTIPDAYLARHLLMRARDKPSCISAPTAARVGARLIRVGREHGAMTGFKNFVMRGNLVELAVAVVIGTQFSSLVKQFVSSFIDPLLSLVGGTPDLGKLVLHVGKATFTYGTFLTEVLTFLISALVVYYAMVLPVSRLLKLFERNQAATTRDCPECTMSISIAAQRCPECSVHITPTTERPQMI